MPVVSRRSRSKLVLERWGLRFAIDRAEYGLPEWRAYYEGVSVGVERSRATEWRAAAAYASAGHSFLWGFCSHCAVGTRV
jgi:hypothetical protein